LALKGAQNPALSGVFAAASHHINGIFADDIEVFVLMHEEGRALRFTSDLDQEFQLEKAVLKSISFKCPSLFRSSSRWGCPRWSANFEKVGTGSVQVRCLPVFFVYMNTHPAAGPGPRLS
jgi:hypothetical protein